AHQQSENSEISRHFCPPHDATRAIDARSGTWPAAQRGAARLRDAAATLHSDWMFDWSDLRYFLAVARHGSTLAAGRPLKTSQSTVQRRLTELERRLGRALVKRHNTGYRLTEFGEQMLPFAEKVEHAIAAFEQQKGTIERGEIGTIRLTCPEPIMY